MNLHEHPEDFSQLIGLTANYIGIPEAAVKRDYYIVMLLENLQASNFLNQCVFKGGTSLSKCYPNSINRFSEDIDLTFIPGEPLKNKQYDKALKNIEQVMTNGFVIEKITGERNDRNKSSYCWPVEDETCRIKLEIGSSVRPEPYALRSIKTFIQEYLESRGMHEYCVEYELKAFEINVLDITRTFLDKVFAVKRHALCGTLNSKVRHIYDVTVLYQRDEIKHFLQNKEEFKRLVQLTKETDAFYLQKRTGLDDFNPNTKYAFDSWSDKFDGFIKRRYESLHKDLLFTDKKQDFAVAIKTFEEISLILSEIDE